MSLSCQLSVSPWPKRQTVEVNSDPPGSLLPDTIMLRFCCSCVIPFFTVANLSPSFSCVRDTHCLFRGGLLKVGIKPHYEHKAFASMLVRPPRDVAS